MKSKIGYLVGMTLMLSSCGMNITNDGVKMEGGDGKMKITDDEVSIKLGDESIEITDDKVKIGSFLEITDDEEGDSEEGKMEGEESDSGDSTSEESDDENEVAMNSETTTSNSEVKEEEEEEFSCEKNYSELFEKHKKNFSDCYFKKPNIDSCGTEGADKGKMNLVVIFDASGSMGASIGGETMMEIAKDKISEYIGNLDENTNLSFVLYGHKGAPTEASKVESCNGVETIYNFSDDDIDSLQSTISDFEPNGWTPITKSLMQARDLIEAQKKANDKNIVLLVSDGEETCGGDPVAEALSISKVGNTFVDVIGFNVKGDSQKQLMDIAKSGNGNYYDVKSRLDFEDTFNKTKNFLNSMSCGASKLAIELNYGVEAINKYYTCMYNLKEEEIFMMADAHESCKDYFYDKLGERSDEYEEKFEIILEEGEQILYNFGQTIEEIELKLEE